METETKRRWSTHVGKFRLYFNVQSAAPFVASVDQGTQETEETVRGWVLQLITVPIQTVFVERENRRWPAPAFWIEGHGMVEITADGWARVWT